jgi:hypothetical protein
LFVTEFLLVDRACDYEVIPVINVGKPKGQSRMDNPEKPATWGIQDDAKYSTICVAHHYTQTNTNNVSMI